MNKQLLNLLVLILLSTGLHAQVQNALAFDGVDDFVSVPNGSGYVAGAGEMSLTCWVYPTNAAPAYPNFDGFAGFRNDTDADFYLVQVGPTALEGRFRNSSSTMFTITSNVLTLNTWQHIAMTYGNGWLKLYKNGVVRDSVAANGTISNSSVNFIIGKVVFTSADFLLTGRIDETSLWSRALTPAELVCMPAEGIDSSSIGLELLYRFNQGIPGGFNIGTTTLIDATGTANGTLNNFTMTGTTSNFVSGAALVNSIIGFTCPDVPYNFNGQNVYGPGLFRDTLVSNAGCDSIVQLQLNLLFVDTVVNYNNGTLTANHVGTTYQWLDCNNGFTPIAGATSQSYTPTAAGSYAVIVNQSSCNDTSDCHIVTSLAGINQLQSLTGVTVSPSLTSGLVTVSFENVPAAAGISVTDFTGKTVISNLRAESREVQLDLTSVASGIYFVRISERTRSAVYKVVRQ